MVNAIQRLAAVVVKKSLQEGFGLGSDRGDVEGPPVVASAVGGHLSRSGTGTADCWSQTQLTSGRSAMRSSNSCTNRRGPPGLARPRANGFAPCFSTTGTSCADRSVEPPALRAGTRPGTGKRRAPRAFVRRLDSVRTLRQGSASIPLPCSCSILRRSSCWPPSGSGHRWHAQLPGDRQADHGI